MAILPIDSSLVSDNALISPQPNSESYIDTDPGRPGPVPTEEPVLPRRNRKPKTYFTRFVESLARETTSDLRTKIFGSDPLR